ncbi:twisted gastrulation protein homolog 1-A-like [Octopus sinensis]|nr:twisted gastrulation protein homolog 1-A-like [Octopus sinensis]XP_036358005.1 twisted gastrulation protein homolog 1-A-like [Octopus sinensis]
MDRLLQRLLLGFAAALYLVTLAAACNDAICASRVSKCQLIKCCECDMTDKKNCTCCNDCQICLSRLYAECCSCVGLCPPPDPNEVPYKSSSIEILKDPIPDLFNVLTMEEDVLKRWASYHYQVRSDAIHYTMDRLSEMEAGVGMRSPHSVEMTQKVDMVNCTVAFMSQCTSIRKCKASCKSMGAARYRWFHDYGCCQCVGNTCPGYGLNEPRCLRCPDTEVDSFEEDFDDDYIENADAVANKKNQFEESSSENRDKEHKKRHKDKSIKRNNDIPEMSKESSNIPVENEQTLKDTNDVSKEKEKLRYSSDTKQDTKSGERL